MVRPSSVPFPIGEGAATPLVCLEKGFLQTSEVSFWPADGHARKKAKDRRPVLEKAVSQVRPLSLSPFCGGFTRDINH